MSGILGGNFWAGFASGAISSIASTIMMGGSTYEYGVVDGKSQLINEVTHKGLLGSNQIIGTLAAGAISGGAGAALAKGNFWQGAVTGLMVAGLNHLAHSTNSTTKYTTDNDGDIAPPGKIKFKGLTKEQLSEFRVIPEDVSNDNPIFTPTKNGTYEGDGFYHKNFSDQKYWYKVSAGGSVTITYSGGMYHYLSYVSEFWSSIAIAKGKYYNVGWEPKTNPHWTSNPFDIKKK